MTCNVKVEFTLHHSTKSSEMCNCSRSRLPVHSKFVPNIWKKEEDIVVLRKIKLEN